MLKKICGFLSGLILLVLLAVAGAMVVPHFFGYKPMAVLTGSMEPNYPVGSMIYVKEADPATLDVGDVITYKLTGDTVVTHRIVEVHTEQQEVITKGDANESNDGSPVPYSKIVGEAKGKIPYLGYISLNIKTPKGILVTCGLIIVIILLTFIPDIFSDEEEEETKKPKKANKTKK